MTETVTQPVYGVLKFTDPDNSVTADERALFALPATKEFREEKLPLRDYRTDPSITKGPAGLDAHGFTVANHRSALEGDDFFADSKLEDVYFPEVEDLVRTLTGCKKVLIKNASFRRKLAVMQEDPKGYYKRGEEPFDVSVIPLEKPLVLGKTVDSSFEPARGIHCDYSLEGLQRIFRYGRTDFTEAAAEHLAAIDKASCTGEPYDGPRYAAYTVWRPLSTVRRDPVAVSDWHSIEKEDFVPIEYRTPCVDGEYKIEAYSVKPAKDPSKQRWFWVPEQTPDEVLVIKLADSEALKGRVAGSTPHGSPSVPCDEKEDPRQSIEIRILALW